jgi:hypothetical protein
MLGMARRAAHVLDGLMRGAVLAHADGVVGPDVDDPQLLQAASRTEPRM